MLRFSRRKKTGAAILLTPLIDIVFLLLIYFLLTSNFVEQEGIAVSLPEVTNSELENQRATVIHIDRKEQFYIDNRPVSDREFRNLLKIYLTLAANKSVVIKADKRVTYDRVAQALDVAKSSGARHLHLTVEKKQDSN